MIPDSMKKNFATLIEVIRKGEVALTECKRTGTEHSAFLVCAIQRKPVPGEKKQEEVTFTPFAEMIDGDPFKMFEPPLLDPSQPPPAQPPTVPAGAQPGKRGRIKPSPKA